MKIVIFCILLLVLISAASIERKPKHSDIPEGQLKELAVKANLLQGNCSGNNNATNKAKAA
jgi:hypothetical protein